MRATKIKGYEFNCTVLGSEKVGKSTLISQYLKDDEELVIQR